MRFASDVACLRYLDLVVPKRVWALGVVQHLQLVVCLLVVNHVGIGYPISCQRRVEYTRAPKLSLQRGAKWYFEWRWWFGYASHARHATW
ncbi:unnamed protein product [Prunus armeniaca]